MKFTFPFLALSDLHKRFTLLRFLRIKLDL